MLTIAATPLHAPSMRCDGVWAGGHRQVPAANASFLNQINGALGAAVGVNN